jgi:Family of unknown function (DUF6941)
MNHPPVPSVLAMLICDQVIIDQFSGKKSLIGVFDNINSITFPAPVNCAVYAKLADAEGEYKFKLRLVNLKDESLIIELEVDGTAKTQTEPSELALYLMGVPLPEPGKYELQLYANEVYLTRITMRAVQMTPPSPGDPPWPRQ